MSSCQNCNTLRDLAIRRLARIAELEAAIRAHRDSPTVPHTAEWDDALEDLYALVDVKDPARD